MENTTSSGRLTSLGYSKEEWFVFCGDIFFFYVVFLWPAIKTMGVLKNRTRHFGRWSMYWIGIPPIMIFYYIFHFFLRKWVLFAFIEAIVGIILTFNNGLLVQNFTLYVVAPIYRKYFNEIKRVPDYFSRLMKRVVKIPFTVADTFFTRAKKD